MDLISVIVPVYNALATLPRCAKSILTQSHSRLELILVDDGSADGSGGLCDALALADERVRVIHQKNGGVSTARNAGLAAAPPGSGWCSWTRTTPWPPMRWKARWPRSRQTRTGWWSGPLPASPEALPQTACCEGEAFGVEKTGWMYLDCCLSMPWNKLFDRQQIEAAALRFDPEYSLGEDLLFCLAYCRAFFSLGGAGFFKLREPRPFTKRQKTKIA